MDALELLKEDHQRISDLFADAKTYSDMKRLFDSIKNQLEMHAHMEETVFYPEYQKHEALKSLVQDAKTQHALIQELLQDLTTCLAYVAGLFVMGYFFLRTREVAK